jgi:predicted nucleic acid-binding protein
MTKPTYVVDASTCLKWIFEDEIYSSQSLSLQKDYLSGKIVLIAPSLWSYEITNGIKSAVSRNRIDTNQGLSLLHLLIKSKPETFPMDDLLPECLENATRFQISVYDSAYVTLSHVNNIGLITSDEKLVRKITTSPLPILLRDYSAVV